MGLRRTAQSRRTSWPAPFRRALSNRQVTDDPPVPIGLTLPDCDIAPAAADRRRPLALGLLLDPPVAELGDARRREHRECVLHDPPSANRPQPGEARLVHARNRLSAAG